ncbi:MAG: 2-hydroxyacid dehydrogenase [Burkholderiaceae bacterium]
MKVAFAGTFSGQLRAAVQAGVSIPCEFVAADEAAIVPMLGDVDVLVSMGFTQAMADAAPHLALLQAPGAGLDRIDVSALRAQTRLANVYGHEVGIAEYIVGAMISLSRSFIHQDSELRQGRWASQWAIGRPAPSLLPELAGKTLLILGYGHIGEALAQRAAVFGMRIEAVRRNLPDGLPAPLARLGTLADLDEMLPGADYVVVTLPLSDETRGLLDARRISRMKPAARLVNVGRAVIIDEQALYEALAGRHIAGAALDVWYRYPTSADPALPANYPFHELGNVLMTPHVSGWTEGMLAERARIIAGNIERVARGEEPLNLIAH